MRLVAAAFALGLLGLAPPCQESNPDFDGADGTGDTSASADTGPSTTASTGTTADTSTTTSTTTDSTSTTSTVDTGSTTEPTTSTSSSETGGCPEPQVDCFGLCVDTTSNPDNCGQCGLKCNPAQQMCMDSMCVPKQ